MKINRNYISHKFSQWVYDGNEPIIGSNLTSDMNDAYVAGFEEAFFLLAPLIEENSISSAEISMAGDIYRSHNALYRSSNGAILRAIKYALECRRLKLKFLMQEFKYVE